MLVDTGACMTILNSSFINSLVPKPNILPVKVDLVTATGEKRPVEGETEIEIELGNLKFKHKVLVAEINTQGILGMDFLNKNLCDVLLSKQCLKVQQRYMASHICRWVSFPSANGKLLANYCDPPMGCPSADGKPICRSANGSDPSADGSDRQMGSNINTNVSML